MSILNQAFRQYGKTHPAYLHGYVVSFLRVRPPSKKSGTFEPYVLLTSTQTTGTDGIVYCVATLPGRPLLRDAENWETNEYKYNALNNVMLPRKAANHILAECAGFDVNKIKPPLPDMCKTKEEANAGREDNDDVETFLSKAAVSEKNSWARQKRRDAELFELFRHDVSIIGHDGTAIVTPKAETVYIGANFGNNHVSLPPVTVVETVADLPEHVGPEELTRIQELRRNTQWFKLADILSSVRENYTTNPLIAHDKQGPQFALEGINFKNNQKIGSPVAITPQALYGLSLLVKSSSFYRNYAKLIINPRTNRPWVSTDDIKAILEERKKLNPTPVRGARWTSYPDIGQTTACKK